MNKLAKNTSLYAIGQILPQLANFILLPIYTKHLTTSDYGIISSMLVFESVLIIFFSLSLERSIFRLYWDYKSEEEQNIFLGTIQISIISFSTILLALLFLFSNFVVLIYKSISFYPFFTYSILTCFLSVFSLVPNIYFMLKGKALSFVLLSLIQFIISAGFILWFIIEKGEGAKGYMFARLLSSAILVPLFCFLSFKMINFSFRIAYFRSALYFSLPIIPTIIVAWILNLSDRVFIERYFSLSDVGIYSLSYKIASIVLLLSSSFSLAFNPMFFKLAQSTDQSQAIEKISRFNTLYFILTLLMAFIVSLFAYEVVRFFLDKKYLLSIKYIPILSLSYVFSSANGITSLFFQQSKKMKANLYIAIIAAILNLILNFILIRPFGAMGAAYATLFSMILLFGMSYMYTKRYCYFVPIKWKQLSRPVIFITIIMLLLQYSSKVNESLLLILKCLMVFLVFIIFMKPYLKELNLLFFKKIKL